MPTRRRWQAVSRSEAVMQDFDLRNRFEWGAKKIDETFPPRITDQPEPRKCPDRFGHVRIFSDRPMDGFPVHFQMKVIKPFGKVAALKPGGVFVSVQMN